MYLTDIKHDFDFELHTHPKEVLHSLEFKKSKIQWGVYPFWEKTAFHSNQGRSVYLMEKSFPFFRTSYDFVVDEIVSFHWTKGHRKIRYTLLKHATNKLVEYWLSHTFLPLYYTIENIYKMLHVGAVVVEGRAYLFAAPSFGGKSTLTHHFLKKGHTLLSDDTLGVYQKDGRYYAVPSYPYSRNYRNMEDLGRFRENYANTSIPIAGIYTLKKVGAQEEVRIEALSGIEKFSVIEMCRDIKMPLRNKEHLFEWIDLTKSIPIYEISVPQDIERIDEVYLEIRREATASRTLFSLNKQF